MDLKLYHSVRKADVLYIVLGLSWSRGLLNIAVVLYWASSDNLFLVTANDLNNLLYCWINRSLKILILFHLMAVSVNMYPFSCDASLNLIIKPLCFADQEIKACNFDTLLFN